MKQIKMGLWASMVMLFTACGGGGSSTDTTATTGTSQTIAINKIKTYADDDTQPAPTIQDYIDSGVEGVIKENINDVNSVVASLTASDVDTAAKIQKIVNDLGINILPTANAGIDLSAQVNQTITITGIGTDIDGTIVSYEWKKDTVILATAASFQYTPANVGTDTLTLTVMDDDGGTGSDNMNVVVSSAPVPDTTAPVIIINGSNPVTVDQDSLYTDAGATATDDRDGTVAVTTTGSVDTSTVGVYTITYQAKDNAGNTATSTRTVNVVASNTAPVANAGTNQNVNTGSLVTLDGSASSDVDQDQLTYNWNFTSVPDGSSVTNNSLSDTTAAKPTFTPDKDGSYTLQLIVNDGTTNSAAASVTVVSSTNYAPTITSPSSVNVNENKNFIMTLTANDNENDEVLFSLIGGDDISSFTLDNFTGKLEFNFVTDFENPADTNQDNIYSVQVSVSDGNSASTQMIEVTVADVADLAFERKDINITNGTNDMIRIADIDNDLDNDIVMFSAANSKLVWLENNGDFNLTEHVIANDSSLYKELYVGDFDKDGDIDIKTLMNLYTNDGNQNFTSTPLPTTEQNLVLSDVDNDGALDIIDERFMIQVGTTGASNQCGSIVNLGYRQNNGDGSYTNIPYARVIYQSSSFIRTVDWDKDNDIDIIHLARRGACLYFRVSLNDGNQNFTDASIPGNNVFRYEVSDMDHDSFPDIVAISPNSLYIYTNDRQSQLIDDGDFYGVVGADFNQDGKNDILTSSNSNFISIYQNISDEN